ncbi:adenylate/guanylate cyclase domain-containing protein [Williamsia deligens]|uniref:Adenylate/guanylate cyclase domain-containing protein n=1 Tax=Williamsia deligens TaxID=321325 RepID=A0ABW3G7C4_9NOCA|nr:adenylate/guanylate cyclase domain-containing protein [Williamsia deligens]MCP2192856.1 Adenylate cyclase, class 3 [Williamsia deligens]
MTGHEIARDRRVDASRMMALATVGIIAANLAVALETALLVGLVTSGGHLTLGAGSQSVSGLVWGLVVGATVDLVTTIAVLRPHIRWFLSGTPADARRRTALQRMPMAGVVVTGVGWVAGIVAYAAVAGEALGAIDLLVIAAAFALGGASCGAATYMILERVGRPLVATAMRDSPPSRAVLGVRERMIVLWLAVSGVPLGGIVLLNIGRAIGWVPPNDTVFDIPTVVLAIICLASGVRAIALVTRSITDPLRDIRQAVERVSAGDFGTRVDVYDSSELGVLQDGFNTMVDGLAERERLRDLFARHVGTEVAARALRTDIGMHGSKTDVGVLFVDIEGSTRFAQSTDPETVAAALNRFFTIVADVVARHDGFINKFEGDAALAVFGAPNAVADPVAAALAAARELGAELEEIHPLRVGIGVSGGRVFAGNIGAETRYEYTVIGDPVNECARLADVAKQSRSNVLASGAALDSLVSVDRDDDGEETTTVEHDECWEWTTVGSVTLRGRATPTRIHAPVELVSDSDMSITDLVDGLIRRPLSVLRGRLS